MQHAVVEAFRRSSWIVVRTPAGKVHGASGKYVQMAPRYWPDLTCFGPGGRVVLVEVKKLGKKASPGQAELGARLTAMGHEVWFIDAAEDAERIVRVIGGTR